MSSSRAARALVCDLDGAVRHYDPAAQAAQAAVDARYGLPVGAIGRACFSSPVLSAAVSGRVSDAQWRAASARTLTTLAAGVAAEAVREWSDLPGALNPDVLDVVAQVRARHPVVLLSNATDRLAGDLERLGIGGALDEIVNTSTLGTAKPEAAAYDAAAAAVGRVLGRGAPPATIALVDDTRSHVTAARALDWQGHVFQGAACLRAFLQDCGLLRHR